MREIKFRAWDKENKVMYSPSSISWDRDGKTLWVCDIHGTNTLEYELINPASELMQFTSLKDCKGVEIYEGDIVEVYDTQRGCEECDLIEYGERNIHREKCENYICTQQIKWNDYTGYFCEEDTGEFCPALGSEEIEMEIIGNIYENPELLK